MRVAASRRPLAVDASRSRDEPCARLRIDIGARFDMVGPRDRRTQGRSIAMVSFKTAETALRIVAWIAIAMIAFVTLGPLSLRPESAMGPNAERFLAFLVVGALFAAAYPRYIWFAAAIVIGAAILLEFFQLFSPSRHGRALDAAVKIVGGILGLGAGWMLTKLVRSRQD